MKKIYISPERRQPPHGKYWGHNAFESDVCYEIAAHLKDKLEGSGFDVTIAPLEMNIAQRAAWATDNAVDLYIPIHTNASTNGKVEGTASGCEMLTQNSYASRRVCEMIYDEITALYPSKRGLKDGSAYLENNSTKAVTAYTEIAFHDNGKDAAFLIANKPQIAAAICKGVCKYFGVVYSPESEVKPNPDTSSIRVEELAKLLKDTYGIRSIDL